VLVVQRGAGLDTHRTGFSHLSDESVDGAAAAVAMKTLDI